MTSKTKVIESNGEGECEYSFTLPNGKQVYISMLDSDFFEKLRLLPAATKIEMMCLTDEQMLNFIKKRKEEKIKTLLEILERKWFWKDSGEEVILEDLHMLNIAKSPAQVFSQLKSKRPPQVEEINKIIEFYTGTDSEVYNKQ